MTSAGKESWQCSLERSSTLPDCACTTMARIEHLHRSIPHRAVSSEHLMAPGRPLDADGNARSNALCQTCAARLHAATDARRCTPFSISKSGQDRPPAGFVSATTSTGLAYEVYSPLRAATLPDMSFHLHFSVILFFNTRRICEKDSYVQSNVGECTKPPTHASIRTRLGSVTLPLRYLYVET
jgi:hypothetical protein